MGNEVKVLKDDMSTWWNKLPKEVRDVALVSAGVLVGIGLGRATGAFKNKAPAIKRAPSSQPEATNLLYRIESNVHEPEDIALIVPWTEDGWPGAAALLAAQNALIAAQNALIAAKNALIAPQNALAKASAAEKTAKDNLDGAVNTARLDLQNAKDDVLKTPPFSEAATAAAANANTAVETAKKMAGAATTKEATANKALEAANKALEAANKAADAAKTAADAANKAADAANKATKKAGDVRVATTAGIDYVDPGTIIVRGGSGGQKTPSTTRTRAAALLAAEGAANIANKAAAAAATNSVVAAAAALLANKALEAANKALDAANKEAKEAKTATDAANKALEAANKALEAARAVDKAPAILAVTLANVALTYLTGPTNNLKENLDQAVSAVTNAKNQLAEKEAAANAAAVAVQNAQNTVNDLTLGNGRNADYY